MELLVYKASAGSGKTFTLAVEYIKHLLLNPRAYQQILAVTFTNKATAEMKERILQQLYGLHEGLPSSDAYLHCLQAELAAQGQSADEADIRRRAGIALQYMLHDYSRFRVETIDSFFQSVMRNLARELELSPNLNIELDSDKVLSDAVDSLIEGLTPTSPVLALLLDYINERIADDKRWNVSDEVKLFARHIFNENYIERGALLREKLRNPQALRLYREVLREMLAKAEKEMKELAQQFENTLQAHNLTSEDLKGGTRSIGGYFRKLKAGKMMDKDLPLATVASSLKSADNWAARTSSHRREIIALAQADLLPLLEQAERRRPLCLHTANSVRLSLQHLDKLQLLNHIDEEVRRLNNEQNRFLLSDTNALLHRLMCEGDSSFVFEKIGANIRHVMIDEFQDTSRLQWDNFRLLLAEGLAQGEDSLIVGDVKQSIYRWRNGDWTILNNLRPGNGPLTQYVHVKTLDTNRRSEARIIDFNNHFFAAAVDYFNALHVEELKEPCLPLTQAYADVAQQSPKNKIQGYVRIQLLEPDKETDYATRTLQALADEVRRLLDQGIRLNDIAILVRKNKNIPPIAAYFDKELGLPIVSDEAFRLDASPAVCLLVDALRCLANPDDTVARATLLIDNGQWVDDTLPETFESRRDELRLMPLYELLEELYALFRLERIEGQEAYLFAFFDAVSAYLANNPSDGFLHYWDETLCCKTIPGGQVDGIRIFSIHKSKGLEFHTVLIPFCDWKLENETNNQLVWCTPHEPPYDSLNLVPVTYSATMASSTYRKDYLDERLQLWVDNLNLLYVAFTRAGKNLIAWGQHERKGTVSGLLADALPRMAAQNIGIWNETDLSYTYGYPIPSATPRPDHDTQPDTNRLAIRPAPLPVQMETLKPDIEFRQSNRSADFIAGMDADQSPRRYIDRGRLLHTLFATIATTDDIDSAIDRLVFEGIIADCEVEDDIRRLVHHAFALPQVQDWYSGRWRLFSECDILWMEGNELRTRRPDRVMTDTEGHVVVVDFKFGKPRRSYSRQVQNYIDLLVRMGHEPAHIEGFLWYVDEDRVEIV